MSSYDWISPMISFYSAKTHALGVGVCNNIVESIQSPSHVFHSVHLLPHKSMIKS